MAILVWTDCTTFLDEFDASGHTNQVTLGASAETRDKTTFGGNGWRENLGGLKSVEFSYAGFGDFDAGMIDAVQSGNLGTNVVHTITPDGDDSSVAYSFVGVESQYQITANIGDISAVSGTSMNARGTDGAVRGRLLLPKQTVAGNVTGTGFQIGDVAANEFLYTAIHVFSAGTTASVIVESDNAADFVGATTHSTTVVTAAGGTWVARVPGAITNTYWRVRTASVTGSFSMAVAVGIA